MIRHRTRMRRPSTPQTTSAITDATFFLFQYFSDAKRRQASLGLPGVGQQEAWEQYTQGTWQRQGLLIVLIFRIINSINTAHWYEWSESDLFHSINSSRREQQKCSPFSNPIMMFSIRFPALIFRYFQKTDRIRFEPGVTEWEVGYFTSLKGSLPAPTDHLHPPTTPTGGLRISFAEEQNSTLNLTLKLKLLPLSYETLSFLTKIREKTETL